jgi:quercetin dioxygenase-like cupin family protein
MSESSYFEAPDGTPTAPGRYVEIDGLEPISFLDGLTFRPVSGERALVSFARYEPNTVVPRHAHEEEQFTFVLEGELEFELDGDRRLLRPGTVAVIPPFVPHAARTFDSPCLQADVFSPPRRQFLEALGARETRE